MVGFGPCLDFVLIEFDYVRVVGVSHDGNALAFEAVLPVSSGPKRCAIDKPGLDQVRAAADRRNRLRVGSAS